MKSDFEAFEVLSILEGIKGLEFGNIKEETVEVGVSHVTGRESSVPSLEPGQYVLKGHSERLIDTPFSLGDMGGTFSFLPRKSKGQKYADTYVDSGT